jgi:hypothetical protein
MPQQLHSYFEFSRLELSPYRKYVNDFRFLAENAISFLLKECMKKV